jgi:hypothetical protein
MYSRKLRLYEIVQYGIKIQNLLLGAVLLIRIRNRVLIYPLGLRSGMNFFRIWDPWSFWLWPRVCSWKHKSKKKSKFALHFSCTVGSGIRDPGWKYVWLRIRDERMVGSGFGIKHPGSATLPRSKKNTSMLRPHHWLRYTWLQPHKYRYYFAVFRIRIRTGSAFDGHLDPEP